MDVDNGQRDSVGQPRWDRMLEALQRLRHRCPSSAGFSHTMEQSARATPAAVVHGPAKGFCTLSLFTPKPEHRHWLGVTPRLQAVSEGGPTRAWGWISRLLYWGAWRHGPCGRRRWHGAGARSELPTSPTTCHDQNVSVFA